MLRDGCSTDMCFKAGNRRGGRRLQRYGIVSISVKYSFAAPVRSTPLSDLVVLKGRNATVTALAVTRSWSSGAITESIFPGVAWGPKHFIYLLTQLYVPLFLVPINSIKLSTEASAALVFSLVKFFHVLQSVNEMANRIVIAVISTMFTSLQQELSHLARMQEHREISFFV
jgi:hypothetical protein